MTTEMLRYSYIKPRSQFGKQCVFELSTHIGVENILPNPTLMDNYVIRTHSDRYTQHTAQLAAHEVQTIPKVIKDTGMVHREGGWPKEINPEDNEATHRYRRRVERSDSWVPSLKNIMPPMEHYVLQNGAVNIYEQYFDDLIPTTTVNYYNIRYRNSYRDPETIKRPVSYLCLSSCGSNRLAAAYSFMEFQEHSADVSPHSYIWDIDYPVKVLFALKSSSPLITIEFNPRDPAMLVGGLLSGQVCCWDIRTGDTPEQLTHPFYSHRYPVTQALWIPSKVNTEFFSASHDGTVKWWDMRFPKKPTEMLVMDMDDPSRGNIVQAIGITSLQYEQTISSRFLAGLENGLIVNVNRRSNDAREKLATRFMGYKGPVIGIDRNPAFLKCFLSVGDDSVKVWADDTKEGCFFSVWEDNGLTGGCWSRSRCSVFFTINTKGEVKAYDILAGVRAPLTSIHPCQRGLTAIGTHENGDLIAVGNRDGDIYMLQCSDDLATFSKDDRTRLNNYLERCGRFEKAVDNRLREIRLMMGPDVFEDLAGKRVTKVKIKKESKVRKKEPRISREMRELAKRKTVKVKSKLSRRSTEPEVVKAETDYFRRIEIESALYTEIDKEDMEAAQELLRERIVTVDRVSDEEKEETEKEDLKRERRSIRRLLSRSRVRQKHRATHKDTEIEDEEDEDSVSTWTVRKKRTGKILRKICGTEVCRPKICCKDMAADLKAKKLKESQRYKMTTRLPEKIRSTLIEDRLFRKLTIQLDDIPELSSLEKRRVLILKNAAPDVLRKELLLAKKEVRIWQEKALARKLSTWTIERKLETKAIEPKEPVPTVEPTDKPVTQVTMKQVTVSKDSVVGRRRSMRKRQTSEAERQQEEMRKAELWKKLKEKAKEHDQEESVITYPRISAAFVKTSSEELLEQEELRKKSQVQIVE